MITLIHMPRTGGTLLELYMKKYFDPYFIMTNTPYSDGDALGIVRNPYDYYVSSYEYYYKKQDATKGKPAFRPIRERGLCLGNDAGVYGREFRNKFPNFNTWFEWGMKQSPRAAPRFFMIDMYNFLYKQGNENLLEIIKLEDISKWVTKQFKLINKKPKVSFSKFYKNNPDLRNESIKHTYQNYYLGHKNIQEFIYEKDKEIFDKHGYTFE